MHFDNNRKMMIKALFQILLTQLVFLDLQLNQLNLIQLQILGRSLSFFLLNEHNSAV